MGVATFSHNPIAEEEIHHFSIIFQVLYFFGFIRLTQINTCVQYSVTIFSHNILSPRFIRLTQINTSQFSHNIFSQYSCTIFCLLSATDSSRHEQHRPTTSPEPRTPDPPLKPAVSRRKRTRPLTQECCAVIGRELVT